MDKATTGPKVWASLVTDVGDGLLMSDVGDGCWMKCVVTHSKLHQRPAPTIKNALNVVTHTVAYLVP